MTKTEKQKHKTKLFISSHMDLKAYIKKKKKKKKKKKN